MADTMTPISDLLGLTSDALTASVTERLEELGLRLQEEMQNNLLSETDGTGETANSIHAEVENDGDNVVLKIYADEQAKYLEHGTGEYNDEGNGRGTPWRYQDRDGNWHTTTGMRAHPFIEPALDAVLPELDGMVDDILKDLQGK